MTADALPAHARRLWRGAALFAAVAGIVGASMIPCVWGGPSAGGPPWSPAWGGPPWSPAWGAPPAIEGLPPGYDTALYVPTQAEEETVQAWTRFAAAIELVRSSRESLRQAESLRGTAARLAQISRENVEARKEESDPAALESARYQQLIAEAQLGLAEDVLASARKMSEGALVIFEVASQSALRLRDGDESQDPADEARSAPLDLFRTSRPQGAARRSRHL